MDLSTLAMTTERLAMTAYRERDAAEVHDGVTPEVARFMSFEPTQSIDELAAIGRDWIDNQRAGREVAVVLRDRQDGRFIGMAGLHYRDDPEPEVGIWIREDRQGAGLGREAVAALVDFAGETLKEAAVVYPVVDVNTRSRRVAEGLGGRVIDRRTLRKPSGTEFPLVVYRVPTS